jgi:hypothetical protein
MTLDLPDREFAGYIFDCDGTLVDSMPLHFRAWTESFLHHGAPWHWTEDDFYANAGVPDRVTVMELNERYGTDIDPDSTRPAGIRAISRIWRPFPPSPPSRGAIMRKAAGFPSPRAVISPSSRPRSRSRDWHRFSTSSSPPRT